MLQLTKALASVDKASSCLLVEAPGLPPGHDHWRRALGHLAAARAEVERAFDLWDLAGRPPFRQGYV